jgi:hypothetical protein
MGLKYTSYKNLFSRLDEQLIRYQLNESTLSQLPGLKSAPGGKVLINFLHETTKLSQTAIWKPLDFTDPDWQGYLKSYAILAVVGVNGVAGIVNRGPTKPIRKPDDPSAYFLTLRSIYKFNSQGQIGPPAQKWTGHQLFEELKTEIGDIKNVWYTDSQRVEVRNRKFLDFQPKFKGEPGSGAHRLPNTRKNKIEFNTPHDSTRSDSVRTRYRNNSKELDQFGALEIVFNRIKPKIRQIAQKELELVKRKIFDHIDNDDYDEGLTLSNAAIDLQDILIATNTSEPIDFHNRNKYGLLIDKISTAIDKAGIDIIDLAKRPVTQYGEFLSAFRDALHRSLIY